MSQYVFAMDVGGTFLDAVVMDEDGRVTTAKVLSTHDDYGRCVRAAVDSVSRKLGLSDAGVPHALPAHHQRHHGGDECSG